MDGPKSSFISQWKLHLHSFFKCYTGFTTTVSNLSLYSIYLTNIKLGLRKEGRMFSTVAQFKMDLFYKKNGQHLQRKLNMTYTHFDG